MRQPTDWLEDIREAIGKIQRYAERGEHEFLNNELVQVWMLYHLQVIGEAARQLGKEFHRNHSDIPWPVIVSFRNLLVHEYFGIDHDEIWSTVEHDIPNLKSDIETLIATLK